MTLQSMPEWFLSIFTVSWAAVLHRPYVHVLFLFFLILATYQMGMRRTVTFFLICFGISWLAEYSSVKTGFPLSKRHYVNPDQLGEFYFKGIPFWGSLLFAFYSYTTFVLAAAMRHLGRHLWQRMYSRMVPVIAGLLMALLDMVIGPLFIRGDQWFLGNLFAYDVDGAYFGVPFGSVMGWFLLGFLSQFLFQRALVWLPWCKGMWRDIRWGFIGVVFLLFGVNFVTATVIAWVIDGGALAVSTTAISALTLSLVLVFLKRAKKFEGEW